MGEGIIPTGDGSEQLVDDLSSVTYVTSDISLPLTEREAKDLTYAFISTIAKTASFINTTIEVVHLPSEERVKQIKKYRDWLLGFTVVETTILASSMALAAIYFATAIVSFGATTASAIAATVCAGISITGVVLSQLRYADVDHVYEIFTEIQENAGYKKLKAYLKTNETELTRFVVNATNTLPISNGSPMNKIEQ
jgi:hypothetical protein